MSHYVSFLKEYTGASVEEFDWGMYVYRVDKFGEQNVVYVEELFLDYPYRTIKGKKLLLTALENTCSIEKASHLMASIDVSHKSATRLLKIYLWNGFEVIANKGVGANQLLYLIKKV